MLHLWQGHITRMIAYEREPHQWGIGTCNIRATQGDITFLPSFVFAWTV